MANFMHNEGKKVLCRGEHAVVKKRLENEINLPEGGGENGYVVEIAGKDVEVRESEIVG